MHSEADHPMANDISDDDHREAGANLFEYFRELLNEQGDKAEVKLHHAHMQSLLMFAPDDIDTPRLAPL
jgi:hypothetical protein